MKFSLARLFVFSTGVSMLCGAWICLENSRNEIDYRGPWSLGYFGLAFVGAIMTVFPMFRLPYVPPRRK